MSDGLSLLTTLVSLGLKLQQAIEKVKGNKEAHRVLVHRINTSLQLLNSEYPKISSKTSPSLLRSIKKLKSDLEYGLESCYKPAVRPTLSNMKSWFNKDSIEAALIVVEKQIAACFQEFTALSILRTERKLGDHNLEVNCKLDELLRRTPRPKPTTSPLPTGRLIPKTHKRVPSAARSERSDASFASSISIHKSHSSDRVYASPHGSPVRITFPPRISPSSSTSSATSTNTHVGSTQAQPSLLSLQKQADHLDSEYRRLRSLNFPSAAVIAARKAVAIRRIVWSMERSAANTADLARSLTYVGRSLRNLYCPDPHIGTSPRHHEEILTVLTECVRLYKDAFRADSTFRLDLAMALYNLSVRHADTWTKKAATRSVGSNLNLNKGVLGIKDMTVGTSLAAALDAANEAVHHFEILENEEPELYGTELANALLNLSFILTDLGRNDRALGTARRAVALCYQYVESLEHSATLSSVSGQNEERMKRDQILHKALMRVSWCLEYLGRREESAEAIFEANSVLKNQNALIGAS
ncbi:hypothetical protein E1B28_010390 [Marasmius oreades]|uniref:Uncharacterized protein n=1 Tax=Marasmius oreades TaxID=181124 RepID=A0A9P7RYH6_9AGAR|nr:uncharacterized protein E1B28_010390 [Marasmius oreades]KAG7091348.1 hypothetical protein E1B28_010390 [Marasmius oreades]